MTFLSDALFVLGTGSLPKVLDRTPFIPDHAPVSTAPGSITSLVNGLRSGAAPGDGAGLSAIYDSLAALARARLRSTRGSLDIRTGDIVNEAYLKLFARSSDAPWESRRHFYGSAARAMQQVVVDILRKSEVERRHSPGVAVPAVSLPAPFAKASVAELLDSLEALERVDPTAAEIVRMRFFVGLQMQETAEILGIPPRSADRKWNLARAWLLHRMSRDG